VEPSPLALCVALVGVLAACGGPPDWTVGPEGTALATRTERNNERLPFSLVDVDNPCTEAVEAIDLEGVIHGQGSVWDNDHLQLHYNVTLSGVDANGVPYQGTSAGNGSGDPGGGTEDVVISTVINSLGVYPNFTTKSVVHFGEDGTLQVDRLREECRG
jgi:hypothetical protein